jgi:hypothetical protein
MSKFQKNFELIKREIITDNMLLVLSSISKLQKDVFNTLTLLQNYFLDNPNVSSINNIIAGFIKKYQPSATELFKSAIKELNDDIAIVEASKPNFKANFASFVKFSHVHKIELWKEINHRKVLMRFINKIDFTKNTYGAINQSFEDVVKKGCDFIIKNYPEYEQKSLKIKAMNAEQLEQKALEIIRNTIIEVVDAKPELIKDSIKRINVELVYDGSNNGIYQVPKSDFIEMFIKIALNEELIYAIEVNQNSINPKGVMCDTMIHELTHAYDWRLNTHPETKEEFKDTTAKILGKGDSRKGIKLAEILTGARNEGIARISGIALNAYRTGPYINIKISLNFKQKIMDFYKLIHQEDILSQNITKAYNMGIIHEAGETMTKIIFLDSTRGKFLYHKKEDDDINIRASSVLSNDNVKEMMTGQVYILAAEPRVMKYEIDNFIKKLSLTPPELFLKKYDTACSNFGIEPIISQKDFEEAHIKDMERQAILDKIEAGLFQK